MIDFPIELSFDKLYQDIVALFFWVQQQLFVLVQKNGTQCCSEWIAPKGIYYIALGLSWGVSIFAFFHASLYLMRLCGEFLTTLVQATFVQGSQLIRQIVQEVISRIFSTLWFLITIIPKTIWKSIFS